MKEDFLHYVWKFKKFNFLDLRSYDNQTIVILNGGQYTQLAGPDFFNAQVEINGQLWAGNVEIHLKSSDWYAHNHERDNSYDSVILHVVWEHDVDVFRANNSAIPILELKNYVSIPVISQYLALAKPKSWIFCESQLKNVKDFTIQNWQERLFLERLERKSNYINNLLADKNKDWETVLFLMFAKNFGLNTNGETFFEIANSIPFNIVRKECFEVENLEALIFGQAGLLDIEGEDLYFKDLKFRFFYLLNKHQIEKSIAAPVQFFKHRPDNFPTVRLSQLAHLYHKKQNLFSDIIQITKVDDFYKLFEISVSDYWKTHYQFDKLSPKKRKFLTKSFIDLLIINTIVPIKFAYFKSIQKDIGEDMFDIMKEVQPEKNAIIDKFVSFGVRVNNSFESQSLLQLKNEYCNKSKCLNCAIGLDLMKVD